MSDDWFNPIRRKFTLTNDQVENENIRLLTNIIENKQREELVQQNSELKSKVDELSGQLHSATDDFQTKYKEELSKLNSEKEEVVQNLQELKDKSATDASANRLRLSELDEQMKTKEAQYQSEVEQFKASSEDEKSKMEAELRNSKTTLEEQQEQFELEKANAARASQDNQTELDSFIQKYEGLEGQIRGQEEMDAQIQKDKAEAEAARKALLAAEKKLRDLTNEKGGQAALLVKTIGELTDATKVNQVYQETQNESMLRIEEQQAEIEKLKGIYGEEKKELEEASRNALDELEERKTGRKNEREWLKEKLEAAEKREESFIAEKSELEQLKKNYASLGKDVTESLNHAISSFIRAINNKYETEHKINDLEEKLEEIRTSGLEAVNANEDSKAEELRKSYLEIDKLKKSEEQKMEEINRSYEEQKQEIIKLGGSELVEMLEDHEERTEDQIEENIKLRREVAEFVANCDSEENIKLRREVADCDSEKQEMKKEKNPREDYKAILKAYKYSSKIQGFWNDEEKPMNEYTQKRLNELKKLLNDEQIIEINNEITKEFDKDLDQIIRNKCEDGVETDCTDKDSQIQSLRLKIEGLSKGRSGTGFAERQQELDNATAEEKYKSKYEEAAMNKVREQEAAYTEVLGKLDPSVLDKYRKILSAKGATSSEMSSVSPEMPSELTEKDKTKDPTVQEKPEEDIEAERRELEKKALEDKQTMEEMLKFGCTIPNMDSFKSEFVNLENNGLVDIYGWFGSKDIEFFLNSSKSDKIDQIIELIKGRIIKGKREKVNHPELTEKQNELFIFLKDMINCKVKPNIEDSENKILSNLMKKIETKIYKDSDSLNDTELIQLIKDVFEESELEKIMGKKQFFSEKGVKLNYMEEIDTEWKQLLSDLKLRPEVTRDTEGTSGTVERERRIKKDYETKVNNQKISKEQYISGERTQEIWDTFNTGDSDLTKEKFTEKKRKESDDNKSRIEEEWKKLLEFCKTNEFNEKCEKYKLIPGRDYKKESIDTLFRKIQKIFKQVINPNMIDETSRYDLINVKYEKSGDIMERSRSVFNDAYNYILSKLEKSTKSTGGVDEMKDIKKIQSYKDAIFPKGKSPNNDYGEILSYIKGLFFSTVRSKKSEIRTTQSVEKESVFKEDNIIKYDGSIYKIKTTVDGVGNPQAGQYNLLDNFGQFRKDGKRKLKLSENDLNRDASLVEEEQIILKFNRSFNEAEKVNTIRDNLVKLKKENASKEDIAKEQRSLTEAIQEYNTSFDPDFPELYLSKPDEDIEDSEQEDTQIETTVIDEKKREKEQEKKVEIQGIINKIGKELASFKVPDDIQTLTDARNSWWKKNKPKITPDEANKIEIQLYQSPIYEKDPHTGKIDPTVHTDKWITEILKKKTSDLKRIAKFPSKPGAPSNEMLLYLHKKALWEYSIKEWDKKIRLFIEKKPQRAPVMLEVIHYITDENLEKETWWNSLQGTLSRARYQRLRDTGSRSNQSQYSSVQEVSDSVGTSQVSIPFDSEGFENWVTGENEEFGVTREKTNGAVGVGGVKNKYYYKIKGTNWENFKSEILNYGGKWKFKDGMTSLLRDKIQYGYFHHESRDAGKYSFLRMSGVRGSPGKVDSNRYCEKLQYLDGSVKDEAEDPLVACSLKKSDRKKIKIHEERPISYDEDTLFADFTISHVHIDKHKGGLNLEDTEEFCVENISIGVTIPQQYYMLKGGNLVTAKTEVKTVWFYLFVPLDSNDVILSIKPSPGSGGGKRKIKRGKRNKTNKKERFKKRNKTFKRGGCDKKKKKKKTQKKIY